MGGGHGWGSEYNTTINSTKYYYSYHSSMRNLAIELGYSIIFPVHCSYCGQLIYLFADRNGGFVIFDELSPIWQKHECWGVYHNTDRYVVTNLICSKNYRFPVPENVTMKQVSQISTISGTLISKDSKDTSDCNALIYDGSSLSSIKAVSDIKVGQYLIGDVEWDGAVSVLKSFEILTPDVIRPINVLCNDESLPTDIAGISSSDIWRLQVDAELLKEAFAKGSKLLRLSLDAYLNGHIFTGMCLLATLIKTQSDFLPTTLKANHVNLLFLSLKKMRLEPWSHIVFSWLSKKTQREVKGQTKKIVDDILIKGNLIMKFESLSNIDIRLEKWLRKEKAYLVKIIEDNNSLKDIMKDFKEII